MQSNRSLTALVGRASRLAAALVLTAFTLAGCQLAGIAEPPHPDGEECLHMILDRGAIPVRWSAVSPPIPRPLLT